MSSQTCAACGCEVGEGVRHGGRTFCRDCANLIMAPDEHLFGSAPRIAESPPAPPKSSNGKGSPPVPKRISAVMRRSDGVEVVEEFKINTGGKTAPGATKAPETNAPAPQPLNVPVAPAPVRIEAAPQPPAVVAPAPIPVRVPVVAAPRPPAVTEPVPPAQPSEGAVTVPLAVPEDDDWFKPGAKTATAGAETAPPVAKPVSVVRPSSRIMPAVKAPVEPPPAAPSAVPQPVARSSRVVPAVRPGSRILPAVSVPMEAAAPEPPKQPFQVHKRSSSVLPAVNPPESEESEAAVAPPPRGSGRFMAAKARKPLLAKEVELECDDAVVAEPEPEDADAELKATVMDVDPDAEPEGKMVSGRKPLAKPSGRLKAGKASARMPARGTAAGMPGAVSAKSARSRTEKGERDSKGDKKRAAAGKGGMSTGMIAGIAGGAVVLLVLIIAATSGKSGDEDKGKAKTVLEEPDEKTPSADLARMAEQQLAAGNVSTARDYYTRAGNKAEKEGNSTQAQKYIMKSKEVSVGSKRSDR